VGDGTAQRGNHQEHRQQAEDPARAIVHAAEDAAPDHAGDNQRGSPGQQVADQEREAGEHGGALEEG
jgi:hypothetical protein